MGVAPATLEGAVVRLEPLSQAHLDGLAEVAIEPSLWEFTIARIHSLATTCAAGLTAPSAPGI